jgi:hypothetical protein
MFSPDYTVQLVDMYVRPLTDTDLPWADLVCRDAGEAGSNLYKRAAGPVRFSAEDDDMDAEEVRGARGARRRATGQQNARG